MSHKSHFQDNPLHSCGKDQKNASSSFYCVLEQKKNPLIRNILHIYSQMLNTFKCLIDGRVGQNFQNLLISQGNLL